MKLVITGCSGFVGRNLIPKLIGSKHDVFLITTHPEICRELFGLNTKLFHFNNYNGGLKEELNIFKPDAVIHLASYLTASDDTEAMHALVDVNIHFLCYLLDALKETGIRWFINTGSFAEFLKEMEISIRLIYILQLKLLHEY